MLPSVNFLGRMITPTISECATGLSRLGRHDRLLQYISVMRVSNDLRQTNQVLYVCSLSLGRDTRSSYVHQYNGSTTTTSPSIDILDPQSSPHDPAPCLPRTHLLHQLVPNRRQTLLKLRGIRRSPIYILRNSLLARERQVQHVVITVPRVSSDVLVRETLLGQADRSFARQLPAVDVAPHSVHELPATHDRDDAQRLNIRVASRIERLSAVALLRAIVVAQNNKVVDMRVQITDGTIRVLLHQILESSHGLAARVVPTVTGAHPRAVAVNVDIGIPVGRVFQEDGARSVVFAIHAVGIALAGGILDRDGVRTAGVLVRVVERLEVGRDFAARGDAREEGGEGSGGAHCARVIGRTER